MADESLLYLYGVVDGVVATDEALPAGVEGAPVRFVAAGAVAGVVSPVPGAEYAESALDSRLADLGWVGERGVAHEHVLTWLADRMPVVPLRPFSLHHDERALRERLREGEAEFARVLDRLRGRREWGVRLWRLGAATARLADHSAALRSSAAEIASASAGRRFLLEKKRATLQQDELRTATAARAREVYQTLLAKAEHAVALALPTAQSDAERVMALNAAFLVDDRSYPAFQEAVTGQAHAAADAGFEIEFTGPWPAYHFAALPDA
jgi:hypothetical protein